MSACVCILYECVCMHAHVNMCILRVIMNVQLNIFDLKHNHLCWSETNMRILFIYFRIQNTKHS